MGQNFFNRVSTHPRKAGEMSYKYDLYGGHSGQLVRALGLTEQQIRERFEDFLRNPEEGLEFRIECVTDQLIEDRAKFSEADRHHCQEITHIEDHGLEGSEKIECDQPANDTWNGKYLCPKHLKLAKDRWKAQGSHFISEHLRPEADA